VPNVILDSGSALSNTAAGTTSKLGNLIPKKGPIKLTMNNIKKAVGEEQPSNLSIANQLG
jgi:hypothetical protein